MIILVRIFISIFFCISIVSRFDGKEPCNGTLKAQIKYFKAIDATKKCIDGLSYSFIFFFTPFCDQYFITFIADAVCFAAEFSLINQYYIEEKNWINRVLITIVVRSTFSFLLTYFIRRDLTETFVLQKEAEKTRDALTKVLDNLPDAVLMLESEKLSYCN